VAFAAFLACIAIAQAGCGRCGACPSCCSGKTDTDGDGWGYENKASCIVKGSQAQKDQCPGSSSGPSSGGCGGYPLCRSSGSDPDGDGWGWEGEKTCIVKGSSVEQDKCPGSAHPGSPPPPPNGQCPTTTPPCPAGYSCGCEIVQGLGKRKQLLRTAGASLAFLASAMMETRGMTTDYPYGDGKTGDSFNAGVAKQNWFLSRKCHRQWRHLSSTAYNTLAVLNKNAKLDTQVYAQCRKQFSKRKFFATHRNGETGFNNPNTEDINKFIASYDWTLKHLQGHASDDVRFFVDVPAI